jgi:DNA-binding CsgD family transcriptional regulator
VDDYGVVTDLGYHPASTTGGDRLFVDMQVRATLDWLARGRMADPWDSCAVATAWPDGYPIIEGRLRSGPGEYAPPDHSWHEHVLAGLDALTPVERELVLFGYRHAGGASPGDRLAEQARRLGRSERTVQRYWARIYYRLLLHLKRWAVRTT